AGALFAQMANDERVPETLRTRAVQMAGVLGVDAVPDEPVDMEEQTVPNQPLAAETAEEASS
ncbi:MAG: tetratricopeptide repeat protein, partial [Parasphingopyxis sp.]